MIKFEGNRRLIRRTDTSPNQANAMKTHCMITAIAALVTAAAAPARDYHLQQLQQYRDCQIQQEHQRQELERQRRELDRIRREADRRHDADCYYPIPKPTPPRRPWSSPALERLPEVTRPPLPTMEDYARADRERSARADAIVRDWGVRR